MNEDLKISDRLTIPAQELQISVARASGSGGQNVNKVNSRVELKFDVGNSAVLPFYVKQRLKIVAGQRITAKGILRLVGQEHRSQQQNLKSCRERLKAMIQEAQVIPKTRRPTKPTKGSQRRRLQNKKARGSVKANRSWRPGKDD